MHDATRDVAAELIAAEQEACARRLQRLAGRRLDGVARAEPRRADGDERERRENEDTDDSAALPREAPQGGRLDCRLRGRRNAGGHARRIRGCTTPEATSTS